jgi:hypothetical protein
MLKANALGKASNFIATCKGVKAKEIEISLKSFQTALLKPNAKGGLDQVLGV